MLEGDSAVSLATDPAVGESADVVLSGEGVEDGDGEYDILGLVILHLIIQRIDKCNINSNFENQQQSKNKYILINTYVCRASF